jgi:hypothetical protein
MTRLSNSPAPVQALTCQAHPRLILLDFMACPICAQDGRRAAYLRQRQDWAIRQAEAVQPPPVVRDAAD